MNILPHDEAGAHRTGSIDSGYTVKEINKILGFKPNIQDDPTRVKYSWGFTVDGQPCGIWDYRGSRWSVFGPKEVFDRLFPSKQIP